MALNVADMNDKIIEAFQFRHATSVLMQLKISEQDFTTILEARHHCSLGLEPWKFLVIQNVIY